MSSRKTEKARDEAEEIVRATLYLFFLVINDFQISERNLQLVKNNSGFTLALGEESKGSFTYKKSGEAAGVIIDRDSGRGYVQISRSRESDTVIVQTGRGVKGVVYQEIPEGYTCMLYGDSRVWYVHQVDQKSSDD